MHPGYGFLSESEDFAKACSAAGMVFVGPKAEHIELFGDKMASKVVMKQLGVPVLEGTQEPIATVEEGMAIADAIGFPVIIKAAFGGGGRGMRIVDDAASFAERFNAAKNESEKYFARGEMFIEKYVQNPRHIEIQIMADSHGNVVHLGERDCSIQRRHQKVIEITPSPSISDALRQKLTAIAVGAMQKMGYESVGTVEFLVDEQENAYFIEMNTRVQVEHPVTEVVTGIDIIKEMIAIADGAELSVDQEAVSFCGYAMEFRINSENPQFDFMPTTGVVQRYMPPAGIGVRLDSALYEGYVLPTCYDSMVAKLIVYDQNWERLLKRAQRALDEFVIEGVVTNIALHRAIVEEKTFIAGCFDTGYLDTKLGMLNLTRQSSASGEREKLQEFAIMVQKLRKLQEEEKKKEQSMEKKLKNFFTLY